MFHRSDMIISKNKYNFCFNFYCLTHNDKPPIANYKTCQKEEDVVGGNFQEKESNRTQLRYDGLLRTSDRKIKLVTQYVKSSGKHGKPA